MYRFRSCGCKPRGSTAATSNLNPAGACSNAVAMVRLSWYAMSAAVGGVLLAGLVLLLHRLESARALHCQTREETAEGVSLPHSAL